MNHARTLIANTGAEMQGVREFYETNAASTQPRDLTIRNSPVCHRPPY